MLQVNITKLIDDVQCYQTVRELRWPDGVTCPSCQSTQVIKRGFDDTEPARQRYECHDCNTRFAQFIGLCSRSKWSKHRTKSPFLALRAMAGSNAAYKIISACSNAVS